MIASVLALLSAAFYGVNPLVVQKALERSPPITVVLVSTAMNIATLWAIVLVTSDVRMALKPSALIFLIAGILAPALSQFAHYTSFPMIGVARAVIAGNTMPVFAAFGAVLFLREHATLSLGLGTLAVVTGVTLVASGRWRDSGHPRNRLGILLAVGAALCTAASALLRKVGLQSMPYVPLGAAVTNTGGLLALGSLTVLRHRHRSLVIDRHGIWPILATGLCTTGGQLAYFYALGAGEVSRVALLINTSPVITILLLRFIFPTRERLTTRILVGAALTLGGVSLVMSP